MTQLPSAGIPRRELVTLRAYLETGSHKAAAHSLGIAESTARRRVSQLMARIGAKNVAQAAWRLHQDLQHSDGIVPLTPRP